ncbi:S-adenosyl-L-methionine-dependent methyltransferase [Periconia macrospinosa]|uniref:S-adenosyl-L-methionine-dependent methyltransferase n=1 Tax=Periconia macrospinosa TaxID=97972 RepID=A0A2V1DD94_9PLEO|nr:S-adenosyl-L-methionine-dependent methyltransferase [Periconia macrospinosa]
MSQSYVQGYSSSTVSNHQTRTAQSDAAFLLPHIKPTDKILDVGCGPGSITVGFAQYASQGTTIGVDISDAVLKKAKALAADANVPGEGPGSVHFDQGDVLLGLSYPDNHFDIVYASQVFGHLLPSPELPLRALAEIRRVLKPGGIVATRDAADQHFYPRHLNLDRLWVRNLGRAVRKGAPEDPDGPDAPGAGMPAIFRAAGFDVDGGKVHVGAGTTVYAGTTARKWIASRGVSQLQQGDAFRQSWLDAGITEEEIGATVAAVQKWAETEDAWFASLQCEILAWK